MRLQSFQVMNFRSIKDSGVIDVSRITALLGRNESGKSNLLRGLHSLNPLDGFGALDPVKNFPRDRRLGDCGDDTPVVNSTWELDDDDRAALADILPQAPNVRTVTVARQYQGNSRAVVFPEVADASSDDDRDRLNRASEWVLRTMPRFFFLDEYPQFAGHQDMTAYLQRQEQNQLNEADRNFAKLCRVAGLDPQELHQLQHGGSAEHRNQLVNRAGAVMTAELKRLWKDRELKIRFNLDGDHFETLVCDPTATYDVEVNLNDRSRGFQWFFAFYASFAADTSSDTVGNAILLLDEPGLYLHAKSQGDLLKHFENDFTNQILYTTHSPFMISTHRLDSVRTVSIAENIGTTVSNSPTGDARTLYPLQTALGYDVSQSLFAEPNNLVMENITDFWILTSVNAYLSDTGRKSLNPQLSLTPAGGAQKVSYMVALLTSADLNVVVLFDKERESEVASNEMVKAKLIGERNAVFVSEALDPVPTEAEIEDLLDPAVYEALVREAYKTELQGKILELDRNIPRITQRMEMALENFAVPFQRAKPARLFMAKMAYEPRKVLTPESAGRFEQLFELINERFGVETPVVVDSRTTRSWQTSVRAD